MSQIDTVIFDVGKVLFDFSFAPFFEFLHLHGLKTEARQFLELVDQRAHEHGEVSAEEFLRRIESLLTVQPERTALIEAWSAIFSPIEEMHDLARSLRPAYRVLLLSNTSIMHWQELNGRHAIESLADGIITSHTVGIMKPAAKIYATAEERYQLRPAATVFIDDIEENIAAATARGWHGIHHRSPAETRRALCALGVQ